MLAQEEFYMQQCFELAINALGETSPNPYVGSVIVKNNKIIGKGYHKKSGENHAEIEALNNASEKVEGATLYCNLEPCCHTNKKTPPCTDSIIKSGIKKVVISNLDPNPYVAGNGVTALKEAGIEVVTGILQEQGENINEVFFHHITNKQPFIHLKWAQTLDGNLATKSGMSKWITGERAREYVHHERSLYDAILVGSKTISLDNPSLTERKHGKNITCKKRIILAPHTKLDLDAKVFTDQFSTQTIIVTSDKFKDSYPVTTLICPLENGVFNLKSLLDLLYQQEIYSLYVEGGSQVITQFIKQELYQRASIYIAPKIIGEGKNSVGDLEIDNLGNAIEFNSPSWKILGRDIVIESRKNLCLQD